MNKEQIEAHEECGEAMHMPTEERHKSKRLGKLAELSYCKICGAEICSSVISPDIWLEL